MTTILIARHGNTFDQGDIVFRVGLKTDLPLSKSGKLQAQKLGAYIKANNIDISAVYSSNLIRTKQTARIAIEIAGIDLPVIPMDIFDELDYGPDEGKTDQEVISRIGKQALEAWDAEALVPTGWLVDPQQIINNWLDFGTMVDNNIPQQTILIITSNGIARFAPHLCGEYHSFANNNEIKLATGSLSSISRSKNGWRIDYWNMKVGD